MSGSKTGGIELHFCRDCGISIPISDIEAGKANPALPGCAYARDNCSNRSSAHFSAVLHPLFVRALVSVRRRVKDS